MLSIISPRFHHPAPTPQSQLPLGTLDQDFVTAFLDALPEITQNIVTSVANAVNATPPPPPDPNSKGFFRIFADWAVDSDGDQRLDWQELSKGADRTRRLVFRSRVACVLSFLFFHLLASASLDLPPEVKEAFRRASVGEDGYLYPSGSGRELIIENVKDNWKDLLDHLDDVPSEAGNIRSAARVVGNAAEELPPLEYLDFLDHYLTAYSRGHIEDEILRWQLGGVDRKNYFITVNAAHPRVKNLLLRAKELVPKENVAFQEYLKEELAGKRTDMYFANKSDDALPPETLPGIKLRTPFESLIAKMHRNRKDSDEATKRDLTARNAAGGMGTNAAAESDEGVSGRKLWILGAAFVVLLFAVWKGVLKKFASKRGTS